VIPASEVSVPDGCSWYGWPLKAKESATNSTCASGESSRWRTAAINCRRMRVTSAESSNGSVTRLARMLHVESNVARVARSPIVDQSTPTCVVIAVPNCAIDRRSRSREYERVPRSLASSSSIDPRVGCGDLPDAAEEIEVRDDDIAASNVTLDHANTIDVVPDGSGVRAGWRWSAAAHLRLDIPVKCENRGQNGKKPDNSTVHGMILGSTSASLKPTSAFTPGGRRTPTTIGLPTMYFRA
jgi:hypothetical protein